MTIVASDKGTVLFGMVWTFAQTDDILPFLSLKLKDTENNDILYYHSLISSKDKFSHSVKSTGLYKIIQEYSIY